MFDVANIGALGRMVILAGGWCIADDGDEEIIELRSSGSVPWREHLAQASCSASSSTATAAATAIAASAAAATTIGVSGYTHAHTSHTLPLPFPQSQSHAQTSTTTPEDETGFFGHYSGSRSVDTTPRFVTWYHRTDSFQLIIQFCQWNQNPP